MPRWFKPADPFGLPPGNNPLSYPRDPERRIWRDWLIVFATLAFVVASFALMLLFAWLIFGLGFRQWGWGYIVGMYVGAFGMAVIVRIEHGHWPGSRRNS